MSPFLKGTFTISKSKSSRLSSILEEIKSLELDTVAYRYHGCLNIVLLKRQFGKGVSSNAQT